MMAQAWRGSVAEGEYRAHWSLQSDVWRAIDNIVTATTREEREAAHLQAYRMAWLLDEVAPIADDCTATPQTDDKGKYWADFIDRQFAQAESIQQL